MSAEVRCVHCLHALTGDAMENAVDGACANQWQCIARQIRSHEASSVPEIDALLGANGAMVELCNRWDKRDDETRRARREAARGVRS